MKAFNADDYYLWLNKLLQQTSREPDNSGADTDVYSDNDDATRQDATPRRHVSRSLSRNTYARDATRIASSCAAADTRHEANWQSLAVVDERRGVLNDSKSSDATNPVEQQTINQRLIGQSRAICVFIYILPLSFISSFYFITIRTVAKLAQRRPGKSISEVRLNSVNLSVYEM